MVLAFCFWSLGLGRENSRGGFSAALAWRLYRTIPSLLPSALRYNTMEIFKFIVLTSCDLSDL